MLLLFLPSSVFALGIEDFNPISHWTCNETSGVRYDSNVVNSNDLTDNNTVLYATGLLGNACDFESTNSEYLSITDANQLGLDVTGSYSLSGWFKAESFTTDTAFYIVSKWAGSDASYLNGIRDISGNRSLKTLLYNDADPADNKNLFSSTFTFNTGSWYHLVWVFDISTETGTWYSNGTQINSSQNTAINDINNGAGAFNLGGSAILGDYFDGLIDEFTFFDYALSGSEVTSLYNSGTPLDYVSSGGGTSTATSTATSTSSVNSDDIVFMLGVIVFFLTFLWFGFIVKNFAKI